MIRSVGAAAVSAAGDDVEAWDMASRFVSRLGTTVRAAWTDGLVRRLAADGSWGVGATGIEFALSLAETALLARALDVADYGRLGLIIGAITSVKLLIDVRAWEAATRYLADFFAKGQFGLVLATLKLALLADLLVALLAYGTTVAFGGLIGGWFFRQPALDASIRWYALSLLFTALNGTGEVVLRVFDRFQDLAGRQVAQAVLHLALVIAAFVWGRGHLPWLIVAFLLSDIAGAAILVALAGRQVRLRLWPTRRAARLSALRPYLGEMLSFTVHCAVRAKLKFNKQIGLLILGRFSSPAQVGYYRIGRRLGASIQQLSDPFYYAAFPEFVRVRAGSREQFIRGAVQTVTASILGVLPLILPAMLFAPELIRVWVGPRYAAAAGPLRVILAGMGLAMATFWATPAALAIGRPAIATAAVAGGTLVNFLMLLALVPRHGAMGAAISLLGGYAVGTIIFVVLLVHARRRAALGRNPLPIPQGRPATR
jgi:O-antigen/teichoic acid export membrane protein